MMKTATARPFPRFGLLATAGAALLLAACGQPQTFISDLAEPDGCPEVVVLRDASEVTVFSGAGRSEADIATRAVIAGFAGRCNYDAGGVVVEMLVDIVAERSPNGPTAAQYDYFVAVTAPDRSIVARQVFRTDVAFGPSGRGGTREELVQRIPAADLRVAQAHEIILGFQLTPAQLDYNRSFD